MTKEGSEVFDYNWKVIMTEGVERVFKLSEQKMRRNEEVDKIDKNTSLKLYK